ncbi:glycosyltransferase family 25 protein [Psychrobacter sp. Pi2-52]|uniref:glycosyltransferase family 25 protein n=1 Tax=Psychrobacter sp. Pi2-52 TaxID=2774133 RepID=UPI001917D283|nr:glycosyltransferase family 25 protein [Psychrobacter sp. Pi2-52]
MPNQSKIAALVINLDSAKERWDFQQKQLSELDIDYQRWEANSVDTLTDKEYERWANDWQRKLRRTEVACFLSHYRAWKYIADSGQSFLILEDDALLSQHLPDALLKLSTDNNVVYHHLTFETRGRKKLISKQGFDLCDSIALHELFLDKTGAAAYLLTPTGAKILIDHVVQHGAGLADALLCHTKRLKSIQSVPALAIQMDMATHYEMPELQCEIIATSNISTPNNIKPLSNGIVKTLKYKSKRISAQLGMGINQLKNSSDGCYQEIIPDNDSFEYLYRLIDG